MKTLQSTGSMPVIKVVSATTYFTNNNARKNDLTVGLIHLKPRPSIVKIL